MDRKEKMDRITQMLKEGVENVFSSENYKKWLQTAAKFHHYSLNNQILILMQTGGTATHVAGYRKWQTLGRQVRKGEKGIFVIAPMPIKQKADNPDEDDRTLTLFKATAVFDISQTTGEELPTLTHVLTGDDASYDAIIEKLISFSPVPITFTSDLPNGVYGCFSPSERIIKVRDDVSRKHQLRCLVHELSHEIHDSDLKSTDSTETKEVRAESVSFIVCNALGIETDEYSFGYIAGWSSGKDIPELKATLQQIRDTADKILSAIMPQQQEVVA